MKKKAIIYNRTNGQVNLEQIEACRKKAEHYGCEVVGVFTDKSKDRPELEQAIQAIEAGKADTFISYDRSRVTRNAAEYNQFLHRVLDSDCSILFIHPNRFPSEA
jgi:DNA invertase Pin-like site-specific DNA recombinase